MKKLHYLLLLPLALAASCLNKQEGPDINRGVDIAAIEPQVEYTVPVRAGYTSVVKLGDEVLAVTRTPITILVPKSSTRADQVEVTYSNEDIFGDYGWAAWWHYVSFEDTRNGDYDYNDVVIHCRVESEVPWNFNGTQLCKHTVSVQPVALGGTRDVKLGILYEDAEGVIRDQILCENVRRDLFFGNPLFPINTDPNAGEEKNKKVSNYLEPFFVCSTYKSTFPVVWFLEAGSDRLYAATTKFGADRSFNMISVDGMPYGISLISKWRYPVERCNIRDAYPGFDEWMRTGDEDVLKQGAKTANTFPATIRNGADGDLWDWQKKPANE